MIWLNVLRLQNRCIRYRKYRYCNLLNFSYKIVFILKIMLGDTEVMHNYVTARTFTSLKCGFT